MKLRDVRRVMPSSEEVAGNPRSRSAVMRVATRTEVLA
jgi:16S rRNA (cytosine1402-N4)-methyltransferase